MLIMPEMPIIPKIPEIPEMPIIPPRGMDGVGQVRGGIGEFGRKRRFSEEVIQVKDKK